MEAQFEDMFGLGSQAPQGPKKKKRARQKSPSQRKKGKKSKRVKDKDKDKDKDKERKHEQKIIERMTDEQKARHEKYTSEKLDKDYIEGILQSLMKNGGKEERLGKTKDDLKILKLVQDSEIKPYLEE